MEGQKVIGDRGMHEGMVYVGGMKMLITFHDKGQALDFVNNKREVWGDIFESTRLWNGEDIAKERIVKLNITGVPIQLREDGTFNEIAKAFGRVVGQSEFSWSNFDVSMGSAIVVLNQWAKVDDVISVEWKSRKFEVKVVEENWQPSFNPTSGLEEGEIRHVSPEKMAGTVGSSRDEAGDREGGEGLDRGNKVHGERKNFNARGQSVNEFNYEGGGDEFVVGVDPTRKRKRRRLGNNVESDEGNNNNGMGLKQSGPTISAAGLTEGVNDNRNTPLGQKDQSPNTQGCGNGKGPFYYGANREGSPNGQENGAFGEKDKESQVEVEDSGSGEEEEDVVMETVFPSGNSETNGVEAEVNNTIRTGDALGVRLEEYKKEVENLVNGDGVF